MCQGMSVVVDLSFLMFSAAWFARIRRGLFRRVLLLSSCIDVSVLLLEAHLGGDLLVVERFEFLNSAFLFDDFPDDSFEDKVDVLVSFCRRLDVLDVILLCFMSSYF